MRLVFLAFTDQPDQSLAFGIFVFRFLYLSGEFYNQFLAAITPEKEREMYNQLAVSSSSSYYESLKLLEADVQHANTL